MRARVILSVLGVVAVFAVVVLTIWPVLASPVVDGPVAAAPQPTFLVTTGNPDVTTPKGAAPVGAATYILALEGEPVVGYGGGVKGLEPTSPSVTGAARLDADSAATEAYLRHLDRVQARAVGAIERTLGRAVDVQFHYRYALNGVALRLTPDEAARLADMPGVVAVERSQLMPLDTDAGPRWIGAGGVWDGTALGLEAGSMGEGIVIGDIDTGINFDHPSFAEVDKNGYEHLNPKGRYLGLCDPENPNHDPKWACNQKLIGAYSFLTTTLDAISPEDDNGHGSHTASTAAGNFLDLVFSGPTAVITRELSGVAPHANLVVYDACYTPPNSIGVCPTESTLAALDQVIADEVDAVNYSIASSRTSPWTNLTLQAFARVRQAGIFAAVSAGNSGPTPATAAAIAPWVTGVAASTHNRQLTNYLLDLEGGDTTPPGTITASGFTAGFGPAPIVYAGNGQYTNVSGEVDDGKCLQDFPPGTFNGEIVLCDRGQVARLDKARYVANGGAGGYILANTQAEGASFPALPDPYVIPGVIVPFPQSAALKTWLASGEGHVGRIKGVEAELRDEFADITAGFSSRGPAELALCCRRPDLTDILVTEPLGLLKPDIIAPGANILAAVASGENVTPPEFAFYDGTSMSAPHIVGAGALMIASHPDWTMAEIQSALMTTSEPEHMRKEDGQTPADPFDYGAGRANLTNAVRAGLVLDATTTEMEAANPEAGGDPRSLNIASLTDPNCVLNCGWTRTVKSTLDQPLAWTATALVDPAWAAMEVTITPDEFTLQPGQTQSLAVSVDVTGLPVDEWAFAQVVLTPADANVPVAHLPIVVRPVVSLLPPFVTPMTLESQGSTTIKDVRAKAIAELDLQIAGLTKGTVHTLSLYEDPTPTNVWDLTTVVTGVQWVTMTVPAGAARIVAEVPRSEATDIDLYVGYDTNGDGIPARGEALCTSAGPTFVEYCDIQGSPDTPEVTFWVLVQNWDGSEDQPDELVLITAAVERGDAGNLTVTGPVTQPGGQPFDLDLAWTLPELRAGDRWYGTVDVGTSPETPGDLGRILVDIVGHRPTPSYQVMIPVAGKNAPAR